MNRILFAVLLLLPALGGAQDAVQPRSFPVPGQGRFVLNLPESWRAVSKPLEQPPSVLLRIGPPTGDAFSLQVTAVWLDEAKRAADVDADRKARLQKSADEQLKEAEEAAAVLLEMRGKETAGYYYSLTSKAPSRGTGDYKYLTQGTLRTGEMLVVFTFLQREPAPQERDIVVRAFTDALFAKSTEPPPAPAAGGFRFDMPDPRLRITVPDIPQFAMRTHPNAAALPHNRFFGDGPDGYSLSILLPTSDAGMTALECARSQSREIAANFSLDPKFVVTHRSNERTYVMLFPLKLGPIVQLKAFLLSATGTHCVQVHASKTLPGTTPDAVSRELPGWIQGFRNATIESY